MCGWAAGRLGQGHGRAPACFLLSASAARSPPGAVGAWPFWLPWLPACHSGSGWLSTAAQGRVRRAWGARWSQTAEWGGAQKPSDWRKKWGRQDAS